MTRSQATTAAHSWSSVMTWNDPGVTMYAFASTGRVQSEEHRAELLSYIRDHARPAADANIAFGADLDSHDELDGLASYIERAQVEL